MSKILVSQARYRDIINRVRSLVFKDRFADNFDHFFTVYHWRRSKIEIYLNLCSVPFTNKPCGLFYARFKYVPVLIGSAPKRSTEFSLGRYDIIGLSGMQATDRNDGWLSWVRDTTYHLVHRIHDLGSNPDRINGLMRAS